MLKRFFFLFLFFFMHLFGETTNITLQGYLDRDLFSSVETQISRAKEVNGGNVIVQINSSSGDIQEVLSFAQEIYELKTNNHQLITIFIDGKAVGPAAILPFLADELIITPLVAWGDIPYGIGDIEIKSIQRTVQSFINSNIKWTSILKELVVAMTDPHYKLVYDKGDTKVEKEELYRFDPLVLNKQGMESLGLKTKVLTEDQFQKSDFYSRATSEHNSNMIMQKEPNKNIKDYISFSESGNNLIGYIYIGKEQPINQSTYIYIKLALEDFIKKKVRFLLLDLNTPGGEVFASMKIVDLLQKLDLQHHIPVIAFIHDWAVSAGAMLAYACRFIAIEPNSIMGAAEPVTASKEGEMISASEKINSALRAEFANLATFYGRNALIAEAMVDKDLILVIRNHQVIKLHSEGDIRRSGSNPDMIITEKGKLLTLNSKELMKYKVADFEVPIANLPPITASERENGTWSAKKELLFQEPYLSQIPNAMVLDYQDWRVSFFSILAHPAVATLLFIGLVIGFYIEINTPGFGIPGSIGIACLGLILLSSFASQAINWIEVIILCVGMVLLAIELFVIPGFGIIGIVGIIFTIIGLFSLMLPGIGNVNIFNPEIFQLVGTELVKRLAWLCGGLIFSVFVIILLAKFFSNRYFRFSKLVLRGEQDSAEGYISGIPEEIMPKAGEMGETVTPLRPSGKVHIKENLYDAMSQGIFLDSNILVEVVRVEGSKLIVKPKEEEK